MFSKVLCVAIVLLIGVSYAFSRPQNQDEGFPLSRLDADGQPIITVFPISAEFQQQLVRDNIDQTKLGSRVSVIEPEKSCFGYLYSKSADEVILVNCICKEVIPNPTEEGGQQCRISHIPFQLLKISSLTDFCEVGASGIDLSKPGEPIPCEFLCIDKIIFKDGHDAMNFE